jgi:hypothetical protein
MTRDEYARQVRCLIADGQRLQAEPTLQRMRPWIAASDGLLRTAWGSMGRYHLSWLLVGRPAAAVRGRPMTPTEEADYVREVSAAKNAVLELSLRAVTEDGMPFVGESGARD